MQIIALAVLLVVLLPVVSLTDDLQSYTAPAEADHLGRRADLIQGASNVAHHALMVVAPLVCFDQASRLQTLATRPAAPVENASAGFRRHAGNLPPPAL